MKLYVKNKLISVGGSSDVLNENQEPHFKVVGKVFSPTKKKVITDLEGNALFTVRNKFWRFFVKSAFVYDANGEKIAKVKKKFWSFRNRFFVEGYKDEIAVEGEFFNRHMPVLKNGEKIGTISREFSLFQDAYCVESDESEIPFLVALTVAIDNIFDEERKDNK